MTRFAITINGRKLNEAEVMTVYNALNSFALDMHEPNALGTDELGKSIASNYYKTTLDILQKMIE